MKVRELREKLAAMNGDDLVLVSRDSEGNAFTDLHAVEAGATDGPPDWEVGIRELTHALAKDGFDEEDVKPIPCVVLWP